MPFQIIRNDITKVMDIEPDDIEVSDTLTVLWEIG